MKYLICLRAALMLAGNVEAKAEKEKERKARREAITEFLKGKDANHDGSLTRDEYLTGEADAAAASKKFDRYQPPFPRPPVRPNGCFRGLPPKANSCSQSRAHFMNLHQIRCILMAAIGLGVAHAKGDGVAGQSPSSWDDIQPGLHSGFGSIDAADSESIPPTGDVTPTIKLQGWKGERVSCKVLVWSKQETGRIEIASGALRSGDHEITKEKVSVSVVKHVLTDQFLNERGAPCGPRANDKIPVRMVPDILDVQNHFSLASPGTKAIWVSIEIPSDAQAGPYAGTVEVRSTSGIARHELELEVSNHQLPEPKDWSFHLDLWQNPDAVARYHGVEPWSEAHMELLRSYLTLLANAGQKCITTTLIDRPWGGDKPCYDDHRAMIQWTKKRDGSFEYDYGIFDRYVRLAMDCGITKQINGYSMLPLSGEFTWLDEDSGETLIRKLPVGSQEYKDHWTPFLHDFSKHLKEKGWLEKTMIAMDERGEEEMAQAFAFLKEVAPEFKITAAGFYHESIDHQIHDYSSNWRDWGRIPMDKIRERKAAGLVTTYYVACGIPKPNNFTFSPPAESCYEGWMASAMGFDGFLRWAYNSWPENPMVDSRYIKWPAGDTYFIYPGPLSSIRFERLREGIQDYEKIRILKNAVAETTSPEAKALGEKLDEFLGVVGPETLNSVDAAEVTRQGKELLYKIAKALR